MDGILIIDKPAGLTSHDVVARIRRILQTRRVGHTGTLDPFATGVMVVCLGKATRLSQFITGCDKRYEATVRLGFATDTQDSTGEPIAPIRASDDLPFSSLKERLLEFRGKQEQLPPMYSAKKVAGVALHKLARQGIAVERKPVAIEVFDFGIVGNDWSGQCADGTREFALRVHCSAGTYVRTLAHDLGERLGYGAHLTVLRRTAVNGFDLSMAWTLESLAAASDAGEADRALLPIEAALPTMPKIDVTVDEARRLIFGQIVELATSQFATNHSPYDAVQVVADGLLIGIARYEPGEPRLIPRVILADKDFRSSN